jgi:hypothetical protein
MKRDIILFCEMMKLFSSSKEHDPFMIILNVVSVDIPVKEEVNQVHIVWSRGDFKRVGKKKFTLSEDNHRIDNI